MIELSIIIVNWNTKGLLCQCLGSVCQYIKNIEMEILVVDNGSDDGSGEAVREKFPKVNLIENRMNLGFARANNEAMALAQGKYLLFLNPDTQIKEETIERLLSFMDAHPVAGLVGAQLLNADGSRQNSIANFPSLTTELLNKSLLKRLFPEKFPGKETDYAGPVEVDSVIGACMMVRRKAAEGVGLLDEEYFLFMEETDWCFRMKKAGWKVYHVPQAEAIHYQGKSAEQDKKRAKVEYYRSRYYFFKKNRGWFHWAILLIGLMAKLEVELFGATATCILTLFMVKKWRKRFSTYVYLVWWHLRGCPEGMGLRPTNEPLFPPFTKGG